MKLHHDDGQDGPCPHMEGLLNRAADGSSKGLSRWYALAHAAKCARCGRFLQSLVDLVGRLRKAKAAEPAPEVLDRLQADFRARMVLVEAEAADGA